MFDEAAARRFLVEKEKKEREAKEKERLECFNRVVSILKEEFAQTTVEVYLVGSLIRPFQFTARSDVDIVLKNFHLDRFELWAKLETKIGRSVEIILFEACHFQDFVEKEGFKVL